MLKKILPAFVLVFLLAACGETSIPKTEITLKMMDFTYNPTSVTIPAGQSVAITLENQGLVEHDFVIEKIEASVQTMQDSGSESHPMHEQEEEFDIHTSAQTGETIVLELTVSEPGDYQFFCSVEGHKEAGMIGKLIVVAAGE